ncbi:unnamed protein product [Brachionus calyciflorus]|uniref:Uncharacterized protein n=1 Tax=Brachionus calyciflorus TaxID=104777 RepID=A0A813SEX1_9BILA|nr:unnamed protein product [Brachionus calyciflorus]
MTAQTTSDTNDWQYGLFECTDSLSDCCLGFWFPSCYTAYASHISDEPLWASLLQLLFHPYGLFYLRPASRFKRDIEGSLLKDVLAVFFCSCCTAIQIKREFEDEYYQSENPSEQIEDHDKTYSEQPYSQYYQSQYYYQQYPSNEQNYDY